MISNVIRRSRRRYKLLSAIVCLFLIVWSLRLANIKVMLDVTDLEYFPRSIGSTLRSSMLGNRTAAVTNTKHRPANSTLGFEKIIYINLPWRYDKDDAMVLQAAISGINVTKFAGVVADDMLEKGLGPSSNEELSLSTKACYRSHMNAWRTVIENNWQTALIMEADAVWDTDVREIMGHFAVALEDMIHLREMAPDSAKPTSDDPYMSKYWDILQLGMVGGDSELKNDNDSMIYYDPYTVPGLEYYGMQLQENERLIRYGSFGWAASAYAVTRKGAMKLLQRSTVDMNDHVDQVMLVMAQKPNFHTFTSIPSIFAQATYQEGLGMDDRNSDRQPGDDSGEEYEEAWDFAREKMSPWTIMNYYEWVKFKRFALWDLKEYLYGPEPEEGDSASS